MEEREMPVLRSKHAGFQRGVSIVEALVALLVLSIGMLGIAVMYLESVRANRTALSRTQAIHLVNDMADRIRANRGARGSYALPLGEAPTGSSDCAKNNCTPVNLASYDLTQWYAAVTTTLPNGANGTTVPQVRITYVAGANVNDPGRYTVYARWQEAGSDGWLETQLEFTQIGTT
jgi:type IV pilus assembly protein PilV